MDLADYLRTELKLNEADVWQVPGLKTILGLAMEVIKEANNSKRNKARLQYHARFVVERLVRIAGRMRGSRTNHPPQATQKLTEFEKILQDVLHTIAKFNSSKWFHLSLPRSHGSKLQDFEQRMQKVQDEIFFELQSDSPVSSQNSPLADTRIRPAVKRSGIRVLSLCGDGVKVLSQLVILRELMEQVRRLEEIGGSLVQTPLRPSDYFDLIVGTGTGAISAIFLGRLGMTVQEAITECEQMTRAASRSVSNSSLNVTGLKKCIEDIVQRKLKDVSAPMRNPNGCHTLVFAARVADIDAPPEPFRSYDTLRTSSSQFTVVDVTAAACAPSRTPVSLGQPSVAYTNAAPFNYNNPTNLAISEAEDIWSPEQVHLVLCIGTGARKVVNAVGGKKLTAAYKHIAADSGDLVHDSVCGRARMAPFIYHRLQVDRGLAHIDANDWNLSDTVKETLMSVTSGYLRYVQTQNTLWSCAETIYGRPMPLAVTQTTVRIEHNTRRGLNLEPGEADGERVLDTTEEHNPEVTGVVTFTRRDIILGDKFHLQGAKLHEAVLRKDKDKVLIKLYNGKSSKMSKATRFLQDLKLYAQIWHPMLLQFIGASNATDSLPFQVYQAPIGECYDFGDWIQRTWATKPVDVFRGLYDMRTSMKALNKFQKETRVLPDHVSTVFFNSIVEVHSTGVKTTWKLIYAGDLRSTTFKYPTFSYGFFTLSFKFAGRKSWIPQPVSAFCDTYHGWINDPKSRHLRPMSISKLYDKLVENDWLGTRVLSIPPGKTGPADLGYIDEGTSQKFITICNLRQNVVNTDDSKVAWRCHIKAGTNKGETVVIQSGKRYKRSEYQLQLHTSSQHGRCTTRGTLTLEYCKKDPWNNMRLWRAFQENASQISTHSGIPPHKLSLVTSVMTKWQAHVEATRGSEPSEEAKDSDRNITLYTFDQMDVVGSSFPSTLRAPVASFDPQPRWLGSKRGLGRYRRRDEEIKDGFTLSCGLGYTERISYWQLPYIPEVGDDP